jgi:integrase
MPKRAIPLTARGIVSERRPGMHSDGNGLYLHIGPAAKSWIFRYQIDGRRRDMGLGSFPLVSLGQARDRILELRGQIRNGVDPLDTKRQEKANRPVAERAKVMTFASAAEAYIAAHEAGRSDRRSWPDTMRLYVNPAIGELPVEAVDLQAVLHVLEPIWSTRTETAKRVRGRIENVLDWASVRGYRSGENPARWRGNLDTLLAKPSRIAKVEHHKALHYRDVPEFMAELRTHEGMAVSALEFVILTCARASEVLGVRWPETDLAGRVWTVPGSRMKSGREHRVPLSVPALAVLDRMAPYKRNSDDHIFLGRQSGRPLLAPALLNSLALVRQGVTTHGFRSTFRGWVAEETDFPGELAELALAHQVGNAVERAYLRSDRFEQRRALAEAWGAHCASA